MRLSKQYILEAKKKAEIDSEKINADALDITKPYKTPEHMRGVVSSYSGDDTGEWNEMHTIEDQGIRRGAESIDVKPEEITPARQAEIDASSEIIGRSREHDISLPGEAGIKQSSEVYSDTDIAKIMNKLGETNPEARTLRGRAWNRQNVENTATSALSKLKAQLMNQQQSHVKEDLKSYYANILREQILPQEKTEPANGISQHYHNGRTRMPSKTQEVNARSSRPVRVPKK